MDYSIQKIWFTADSHFGHNNIIKYCHRPFESTDEMDDVLIQNINNHVQPNDFLYHMGDWCHWHGNKNKEHLERMKYYRNRIKCKNIHLITGNHDPRYSDGRIKNECREFFSSAQEIKAINVYYKANDEDRIKIKIILCHYAMTVWDGSHYGSWNLYGHSHFTLSDDPNKLSIDVGVDAVASRLGQQNCTNIKQITDTNVLKPENYRPMCLGEIYTIMQTKSFEPTKRR